MRRPEQLAHTHGHVQCPACEEARALVISPGELARLSFPDAAHVWLSSHKRQISERTAKDYRDWTKMLTKFFGSLRLDQIHIGHIEQYQAHRLAGTEGLDQAGPVCINHELGVLCQILKRAGLWAAIDPHYQPLRIPKSKRNRALTEEEEERLFRIAESNPRWLVAYLCSLITVNTTAGPGEIRKLRLRDVNLGNNPYIQICEGAKNEYRIRPIPLIDTALWAVSQLVERARDLGATHPDHYLLPHRAANGETGADPTRPMGSWRKAWESLREADGMPDLRMYSLRHHVITKLLEDENVSERTVIELAGHVSKDMLQRYSHIRMKTKLGALKTLERKPSETARSGLQLIKK